MSLIFKYIDSINKEDGHPIGSVPIAAFYEKEEAVIDPTYPVNGLTFSEITATADTLEFGIKLLATGNYDKCLIGDTDFLLKADPKGEFYELYDVLTHKAFTDYIIDSNTDYLYTTPESISGKVIAKRSTSGSTVEFVSWSPRYPYSVSSGSISGLSLTEGFVKMKLMEDPLDVYVSQEKSPSPKEIHLKKNAIIYNGKLVNPTGGKGRRKYVTKDTPTFLTSRLLKLSHKGISTWSETENLGLNECTVGSFKILCNYNITIADVDLDKGLLLVDENIPHDVEFSYELNTTDWLVIGGVNYNPAIGEPPNTVKLKLFADSLIYYAVDGSNAYKLAIEDSDYDPNLPDIAGPVFVQVTYTPTVYDHIDARIEGGQDIDTENRISFVDEGYVEVKPLQTNIALIKLPTSVLENLVAQFEELHYAGLDYADFSGTLREYILSFSSTEYTDEDPELQVNDIENEVMEKVHRYLPLGVLAIVTNKSDEILFKDTP